MTNMTITDVRWEFLLEVIPKYITNSTYTHHTFYDPRYRGCSYDIIQTEIMADMDGTTGVLLRPDKTYEFGNLEDLLIEIPDSYLETFYQEYVQQHVDTLLELPEGFTYNFSYETA